jgi:hypothetical protein
MQNLGSAETLADVQKSPLIQNLVQSRVRVERQISELSATLLPGHPRMRQLAADLKGLKTQIAAEVSKIVEGIGKEAKVAALREAAIQRSVDETKSHIVNAGPEEAKLRSLEADARSKRAELDRLRAQYEANRVRADDSRAIPVEAQIVSSARPSTVPVFPKKGATAMLVAVATVLIGLALVVTRGLLSGSRVPRAPRRGNPVRARPFPALPDPPYRGPPGPSSPPGPQESRWAPSASARAVAAPAASRPATTVAEVAPPGAAKALASPEALAGCIEALRQGDASGTRTLLVGNADVFTLAKEAEAVCRRLAARGQAVVMIDWSLNGAGIAEPLGAASFPGFSELLDGTVRFEDVVRALRDSDVQLIASGRALPASADPLDGDSLNFLLDALDDVYDHIVVVSRFDPARRLFEAIEGRFDCGAVFLDAKGDAPAPSGPPGSFLGFEVEGIALFTVDANGGAPRQRARMAHAV